MNSSGTRNQALTAAMIGLAPVLLCQGFYVRRVTPKLPEADGLRQGETGSGPLLRLLLIGDSAAAGVGASTQEQALIGNIVANLADNFRVQWALHARTGETTRSALKWLAEIPWRSPAANSVPTAIVVSLGVNDVTSNRLLVKWLADLAKLRGLLQTKFGATQVIFSGVPPMHRFPALPQPLRWYLGARARRFDQALRSWAENCAGCDYLQAPDSDYAGMMASDGFHPGPAMYALWGAAVARRIRESSAVTQQSQQLTPSAPAAIPAPASSARE
jgi:lysophospholipase L1-like esterase